MATLLGRAAASLSGDLQAEQVMLYDLAFAEAELQAAQAFVASASSGTDLAQALACLYAAESSHRICAQLGRHPQSFGLNASDLQLPVALQHWLTPQSASDIGQKVLQQGLPMVSLAEEHTIMRDTFAAFAADVVAPLAESIHRQDLLVPEAILQPLREMGCFGLSIPTRYGGLNPDDGDDTVGMVVVTEELSRASLGAAGSLITRPEIMARALLEGGTEAQKARWLPQLASGEKLCAISVTEPNTGSDVANVALKATRTPGGWLLNGGKTWCTFAGKAEVILLLARTDSDIKPPHKGLSLFLVEKPEFTGHDFEHRQPDGGRISGRAIATLGYRGMHSFEMFYDNYFVPDDCLIGESQGCGRGFYFTMRGFMGGRIQTAARACGLMRAAYDAAVEYAQERQVFNQPVAQFPLSQAKIARMAAVICASQAHTLNVAQMIDQGRGTMEASLVKLSACKAAEWVTREAVQLFGGMGYAEETSVSRYFADARVLSIFEGAEETLAIRVIGKALVERATA